MNFSTFEKFRSDSSSPALGNDAVGNQEANCVKQIAIAGILGEIWNPKGDSEHGTLPISTSWLCPG